MFNGSIYYVEGFLLPYYVLLFADTFVFPWGGSLMEDVSQSKTRLYFTKSRYLLKPLKQNTLKLKISGRELFFGK